MATAPMAITGEKKEEEKRAGGDDEEEKGTDPVEPSDPGYPAGIPTIVGDESDEVKEEMI